MVGLPHSSCVGCFRIVIGHAHITLSLRQSDKSITLVIGLLTTRREMCYYFEAIYDVLKFSPLKCFIVDRMVLLREGRVTQEHIKVLKWMKEEFITHPKLNVPNLHYDHIFLNEKMIPFVWNNRARESRNEHDLGDALTEIMKERYSLLNNIRESSTTNRRYSSPYFFPTMDLHFKDFIAIQNGKNLN